MGVIILKLRILWSCLLTKFRNKLNMIEKIKRGLDIVFDKINADKSIYSERVVYIFVKFRQYLEVSGHFSNFPHLNLYSNWILHTTLSESPKAMTIVSDIGKIAADFLNKTGSFTNHNDRVCEVLSIKQLRKEINQILQDIGCTKDNGIFKKKDFWDNFVGMMMVELMDKPLILSEPINTEKYERLLRKHAKLVDDLKEQGFIPSQISLTGKSGEQVDWKIEATEDCKLKGHVFEGGLFFTESEKDFN